MCFKFSVFLAVVDAKTVYYMDKNKNNPRFLFSTIARLTESHCSIEPSIPVTLNSNDFMG